MKRFWFLAALLLVLIPIGAISCAPSADSQQIWRLQAEVDSLRNSLSVTQQELATTQNSLYAAQTQVQSQSQNVPTTYAASSCAPCQTNVVAVAPEPYFIPLYPPYPPEYQCPRVWPFSHIFPPHQPTCPQPPVPPHPPFPPHHPSGPPHPGPWHPPAPPGAPQSLAPSSTTFELPVAPGDSPDTMVEPSLESPDSLLNMPESPSIPPEVTPPPLDLPPTQTEPLPVSVEPGAGAT